MKKTILSSILALSFTGLNAQPQPVLPQLVVMLTVDQLRTDYLEAFSALYGEKGLKRLLRGGRVFRQAHYPFSRIDRASAIAALYSGSTPAVNGIVGENWWMPPRCAR